MARPRKPSSEKRSRKIILWVNDREQARYLINAAQAALTPADFGRDRLCYDPGAGPIANDNSRGKVVADRELAFARIDALNRVGTGLAQLIHIIERTGHVPSELPVLIGRVGLLLDQEFSP
jgi:hypothetical protein